MDFRDKISFENRRSFHIMECYAHSRVAPHWGAWIEIGFHSCRANHDTIAPHWGAWIEIPSRGARCRPGWSHPTGVRGLKSIRHLLSGAITAVAPHWGAWIEISTTSHSSSSRRTSHPTGVRGLKWYRPVNHRGRPSVAPHWGAWIEMRSRSPRSRPPASRTPLGCVD